MPTIWAISRALQRFRFHLIFGMCFGAIAAATTCLVIEALARTSSTWSHSSSTLLRTSCRSLLAFLGTILDIPSFIGLTLSGSVIIYWVLVLVQWSVVGLGISFLFRSRHWFFNSTALFWWLFPLTFVPVIFTSSGTRYWCGFGIGQPWEWLYYCEDRGPTFFSTTAFFEDLSVGLVSVILVWQLAKFVFGKREPRNRN
jgi:hypothetical protein